MSNVFDRRTYQQPSASDSASFGADYIKTHDMNGIPYEDRETNVHVRALCFCLLDWLFTCHTFTDDDGVEIDDAYQYVFIEPMADIVATISSAVESSQEHHAEIPAKVIQEQILLCFQKHDVIGEQIAGARLSDGLTWGLDSEWTVSEKAESIFESTLFIPSMSISSSYQFFLSTETYEDYMQYAHTAADDKFFGAGAEDELPDIEGSAQYMGMSPSGNSTDEDYVQPKRRGKSKSTKKRSRGASDTEQVDERRKKQKTGKRRTTTARAGSSKQKG